MTVADETPRSTIDSVHEAALSITAELSLPVVLERIVNIARDLVGARYAALGVPRPGGRLDQFIVSGMPDEEIAEIEHYPEGLGVLGLLIQPGARPIRLRNVQDHPAAVGFPAGHPSMTSFLGVPIVSRGELLGSLYIANKIDSDEFDDVDLRLIEMLAAHAAVAIENARLYEQVRRLAVLEERERIGMDLHDGIIQSIYAVGLTLEYATFQIDEDLDDARERLRLAVEGLNAIIKDIRNYILDLRPQKFSAANLVQALRNLLEEFRANTLAEIALEFDRRLEGTGDSRLGEVIFHIVQEALANASKHASASHVAVSVGLDGDRVLLRVRDDGRGYDQNEVEAVVGHGLSNMEMRAQAIGGRVEFQSAAGEGTVVRADLPYTPSE